MQMQQDEEPIPIERLVEDGAELRDGHGKANAIIRSSMAIVSIVSSSILIWMIRRSYVRLSTTYHRLLLGMCIADILLSLSLANFNVMAPRDDDYFVWNVKGNQITCSIQGFFTFVGAMCGIFYNCSLNVYYLAVVKYHKSDTHIRRRVEPFLHLVPVFIAVFCATILLIKQNINHAGGGVCYAPVYSPPHCTGIEDGQVREGFEIPCGRGSGGGILFHLRFFVVLIIVPIFIGISLAMIYRSVAKLEIAIATYGASAFTTDDDQSRCESDAGSIGSVAGSRTSRLTMSRRPREQRERAKSRAVLHRAFGYAIAYFLTWSFVIIGVSMEIAGMEQPLAIWYLESIFNPLQGFYNLVNFLHPKVMSAKRSRRDNLTWRQAITKAFWSRGVDGSRRSSGEQQSRNNNDRQRHNAEQPSSSAVDEEKGKLSEKEAPEAYDNMKTAQ